MLFKVVLTFLVVALDIQFCFGQPAVENFHLSDLVSKVGDERPWHAFLDRSTIRAGVYYVSGTRPDSQTPHEFDEIYYCLSGEGQLQVGDTVMAISPGTIVFVRAGMEHRFVRIEEPVVNLVLFAKAQSNNNDHAYTLHKINSEQAQASPTKNIWNPFINSSTLTFGLYMLPKALGGDATLTHKWDELNFVVKGSADFIVDGVKQRVKTGDLVFVAQGNGHNFNNLSEDFEVLILFEKKSRN